MLLLSCCFIVVCCLLFCCVWWCVGLQVWWVDCAGFCLCVANCVGVADFGFAGALLGCFVVASFVVCYCGLFAVFQATYVFGGWAGVFGLFVWILLHVWVKRVVLFWFDACGACCGLFGLVYVDVFLLFVLRCRSFAFCVDCFDMWFG